MKTETTNTEREFLQRREVEEIMGVSAVTLWRWVKKGILPKPTKVGNINYFKKQDIMDVLNGKA